MNLPIQRRKLSNFDFVRQVIGTRGIYVYGDRVFYQDGWLGCTDGHRAHFVKLAHPPEWSGTIDVRTGDADPDPKMKIRACVPKPRGDFEISNIREVRAELASALTFYKAMKEKPQIEVGPGIIVNAGYFSSIIDGLDLITEPVYVYFTDDVSALKFTQGDREAVLMPMKAERPAKFSISKYIVPAKEKEPNE